MNDKDFKRAIIERVEALPEDSAVVTTDFADLAPDATIWQTLKSLADEGRLVRAMRGVYYKPKYSKLLGEYLPPNVGRVAQALSRARKWSIAPIGDLALNWLGLSTQVPARWIYLSTGPYASYDVNGTRLEFRHTASRDVVGLSETGALVVQALKALGEGAVDEHVTHAIAARLNDEDAQRLKTETLRSAAWVRAAIKAICEEVHDA